MNTLKAFLGSGWPIRYSRIGTDFFVRLVRGLAWPKVDLLIRLWLSKIFFMSGMVELIHWKNVIHTATLGHNSRFISPVAAAHLGVSITVLGAALLAMGFMTRYAAAVLLGLSVVIRLNDTPVDSQLFWAALFVWYTVMGAGALSIDRLLRRGLAHSALPAIPGILRLSEWIRSHLGPSYISALRIWLALALLTVALESMVPVLSGRSSLTAWLPVQVAAHVPAGAALVVGVLLLLGLATRYLGLATIAVLFTDAMMDPRATDAVYLLMIFSILIAYGGGSISVDRIVAALLRKHFPAMDMRNPRRLDGLPRVVIVGAGFGGMSCAAALRKASVAITIVDQTNFHLFQPLLYQVATAALSPGDIAAPIRSVFRDDFAIRVLLGTVTGVDSNRQIVQLEEQGIPYDYLVLATGATHSYFGKDEWARYSPGLKRVEDALEIRRRVLTAFEHAEATADEDARASLLTFLIVGGGPTGVELAGAIAELARFGMDQEFRMFHPAEARVILVQSAPRLLPALPESLASFAQRSLEKLGVQVLLGRRVEHIDDSGVVVGGERIPARTVLWAAGVAASPAAKWLQADCDGAGRIKVGANLDVPGMTNVFAIGDTAASSGWKGQPVPGLAHAAKQGGRYVAMQIRARVAEKPPGAGFKYRHLGSLATIGRKAAVADFGFLRLWGEPAWWLWGAVHIGLLAGTRNRIATMINWFWAYLTFSGGIRLITGFVQRNEVTKKTV